MKIAIATILSMLLAIGVSTADVPGNNHGECEISREIPIRGDHPMIGVYDGDWDGKLLHTVVILSVDGKNAETLYSHGKYSPWGIDEPGCFEVPGKISGNKLTLQSFRNGAVVNYYFKDDYIYGTYDLKGRQTVGEFNRLED